MNTLTSAVIAAWFSTWAGHATLDHDVIADVIATTTDTEGEARIMAAIAIRESGARVSIWGDGHHSACWAQIYVGASRARGEWLNANPLECAKAAVAAMRTSVKTCAPDDALGLYATGHCGTKRGIWVTFDRMKLARSFVLPKLEPEAPTGSP